jgi:hypothetical protein
MMDAENLFVVVGVAGLALLLVALVAGEVLDGLLDGLGGGWFSGAVVGGFISAFGFGAALAEATGAGTGVVVAVGVAAGAVVGGFAGWLTRTVRSGGTDSTPRTHDAVGLDGTVVSGIPVDGYGTISVRIGGHLVRYNARAELPLEPGTPIHVTGVLSPTAVDVAPL